MTMTRLFRTSAMLGACGAALFSAGTAGAAVSVFQSDLAGFNLAAGTPTVAIDFESLSDDIAGTTVSGVTFSSPDGNTLEVVTGASTSTPGGFSGAPNPATNVLIPTSGSKVLSPGGSLLVPGPALGQKDSLRLDFTTPLKSFGLDILHQSFDCCTFVSYTIYNANGVIASGGITGGSGGGGVAAGTSFFGVTSTDGDITRIVFTDNDDNDEFPDANIGFDTLRFGAKPTTPVIPEPATWAMMIVGFGLIGAAVRRKAATVSAQR